LGRSILRGSPSAFAFAVVDDTSSAANPEALGGAVSAAMAAGAMPSTSVAATSAFFPIDTIDSFSGVQIETTVEIGL
jgi:hypothetical protein